MIQVENKETPQEKSMNKIEKYPHLLKKIIPLWQLLQSRLPMERAREEHPAHA